MDDEVSKCPVMHGAITSNSGTGTSNREWWPNQLNLNILHQHGKNPNPENNSFNDIFGDPCPNILKNVINYRNNIPIITIDENLQLLIEIDKLN